MAVAYQSSTAAGWANISSGDTRNFTLPSGTAAGDLLICAISAYSDPSNMSTTPAGWVDIASFAVSGSSNRCIRTGYIIATSTIVTAGVITIGISWAGGAQVWGCGIQRWTGHSPTNPIASSQALATGGNTAHVITPGITPVADCGFAAFAVCQGQPSWTTCTMATSDPTFTNRWNVATSLGTDAACGGWSSGARSSSAATGDITLTTNSSTFGDAGGVIIAIQPPATGPANLKTYDDNAKANIKTINTNAIANIKTLNTNV